METNDWDDISGMDQLLLFIPVQKKGYKGMSFRIVSGKSQMFQRIRTENPKNI